MSGIKHNKCYNSLIVLACWRRKSSQTRNLNVTNHGSCACSTSSTAQPLPRQEPEPTYTWKMANVRLFVFDKKWLRSRLSTGLLQRMSHLFWLISKIILIKVKTLRNYWFQNERKVLEDLDSAKMKVAWKNQTLLNIPLHVLFKNF